MDMVPGSTLKSPVLRIRQRAAELGFFGVGVAPAGPLPLRRHFDEWLERGRQGEMNYLERQAGRRRNPGLVLENARSIVTVAANYHTGLELTSDPLKGRISRYAWGDDYHVVMKDRLEKLLRFVQERRPGARGLCYVDAGPVAEKVWGAESALGWLGKNSNLISRARGSWFFLGAILLDIELDYDPKERDYCGRCTRCLSACPTGAIISPYVVDARLCISYLTIELRGPIPLELRPLIGNRIFGCDDCQEVCPWNRFAIPTSERAFWPRDGNLMPFLAPLAGITEEQFQRRFSKSPIRRAKRNGFVRNVCVALGNSHRAEAVEPLRRALNDESALVREHAAWGLSQIL
jgi:epoxyqueuosine reductase